MDVAREVVELFTTKDEQRQLDLAKKLNALNAERQAEEQRILEAAIEQLEADAALEEKFSVVLDGDGWHRGVIGIVATRVVERTGRPTLVVSRGEDGVAHGSGRSIPAFHLLDALESSDCRHCFIRFGGHAHAAGFSLASDAIPTLRDGLERYARAHLTREDLVPGITIDAELEFAQIDRNLIRAIARLEPFGVGNPRPLFGTRAARMLQPMKIMKEKHAKLRLRDSDAARPFDAVGWRMREQLEPLNLTLGEKLDIAYTVEENTDPDFFGLQLILRDVRRSVAALTTR